MYYLQSQCIMCIYIYIYICINYIIYIFNDFTYYYNEEA